MLLRLIRFHNGVNDTLGILKTEGRFLCFTLEDEMREVKIPGETRIPDGIYEVKYTFSPKFGKNMLEIMNVPNFTGIRIHTGNTDKDTAGCILLGDICNFNPVGTSRIEQSKEAYDRVSSMIIAALNKENVLIWIGENL